MTFAFCTSTTLFWHFNFFIEFSANPLGYFFFLSRIYALRFVYLGIKHSYASLNLVQNVVILKKSLSTENKLIVPKRGT